MKKRKVIGCIINNPESQYQSRALDGLISQCEAYDYDMAVFSPLVDVTHYFKDYMHGDQNILYLANFDYIDAVVIASTPLLAYDGGMEAIEKVKSILSCKCKKPVIMMDSPVDDYEVVETDDAVAMEQMTAHVLDVHGCNPDKIYFLTGAEGHVSSLKRMAGCEREYKKRGYEIKPENVFYGDFWYTAGYALADRIISGELEKPEAVIVHSDHMAMGVINRLSENGIRVPEDVIVTGYDATEEGIMNKISVTSFTPRVSDMAASAIDRIHAILEPDSPMKPHAVFKDDIRLASSCGCGSSVDYLMHYLENAAYKQNIDYTQGFIQDNNNVSLLMESYMMEEISQSESFEECLRRIYMRTYLLRPYDHFYICLRENWLDMNVNIGSGYPEAMSCVIHAMPEDAEGRDEAGLHYVDDGSYRFDTSLMLPQFHEERENPNVFYFVPVHFQGNTLGYAVLQCETKLRVKPTCMFRNWLRYVNTGLEMIRIRNKLVSASLTDSMTSLYNRRGMELRVREMFASASPSDSYFVMLIDMDGLKMINDKFGHNEGDRAILSISSVARSVMGRNEIVVRAGGDEFYIIGVGDYDEKKIISKAGLFDYYINEKNRNSTKGYELSASIGYCIKPMSESPNLEELIRIADDRMYANKIERKKNRKI